MDVVLTNLPSGRYQTLASYTPGELYVIGAGGIAEYIFKHLNSPQYDGDAVHVAANFANIGASNYVDLGCVLNLSGGAAEWTTMNAQIQSIEEDFFAKTTTVQIGVAKHLNSGQLSSMLNMWHSRRTWYNTGIRTDPTV